jgi:hypothetical protein
MFGVGRSWRRALLGLAFLLALSGSEARAWITLAEGEKGKLELEARLMIWAVREGPDFPYPAGTPAQDGSTTDFMIRRARLLMRAQLSPRLDGYLQFGQDNVASKIFAEDAGFRVKDAYLNYKPADAFQLLAGQFKVPFLRQNLQGDFDLLLVERAGLTALRPAREGSRDVGGMVWGNAGGFQYRAALFDGSDQERTTSQSSLRGSTRLSWNWFTRETGVSYPGTTLGEKRVLQFGIQGDRQDRRLDSRDDSGFTTELRNYRSLAADVYYEEPFTGRWSLTLEGAYLDRRDDYANPALNTRHIDTYYTQAGLLLPGGGPPGRFQLTARYEKLDSDRGAGVDSIRARTFGLNWFAPGEKVRIQTDWTHRSETPVPLHNEEIRLSIVSIW